MKWYVMVFFLSYNEDGTRDTFIFNNPVYNSEMECRVTLTNKTQIMKYVHGLMLAYDGALPGIIEMVNCINQDAYDEMFDLKKKQEGEHDT